MTGLGWERLQQAVLTSQPHERRWLWQALRTRVRRKLIARAAKIDYPEILTLIADLDIDLALADLQVAVATHAIPSYTDEGYRT